MPIKFQNVNVEDVVFSEALGANGLPVVAVSIDGAAAVPYANGSAASDGTVTFTPVSPNPLLGLGALDFTALPEDEVVPVGSASSDNTTGTLSVIIDGTKVDLFTLHSDGSNTLPLATALRPGGDFAVYDDGAMVIAGYARPGAHIKGADAGGIGGGPTGT